jgi:hypothetical protein
MTKHLACLTALGLAAGLAGCGSAPTPAPQAELDRAQAALQATLDAWKKGARPGALKGPVVAVTDPDWAAGLRLQDYMIYNTEGREGEGIRCGVALALSDRQGHRLTRDVVYSIRGTDKLVIAREPEK